MSDGDRDADGDTDKVYEGAADQAFPIDEVFTLFGDGLRADWWLESEFACFGIDNCLPADGDGQTV